MIESTTRKLPEEEQHLFNVMSSDKFLKMQGLGNELPFFIYPFPPQLALEVESAQKRITNRLENSGIHVAVINIYDIVLNILNQHGVLDDLLSMEPGISKVDLLDQMQSMLDPSNDIAPAIKATLDENPDAQIVFLTGVGEVFPYIRTHNVLNNLQSVIKDLPVLTWFHGVYEQSDTIGSALSLFGLTNNDQYYRARDIRFQEA